MNQTNATTAIHPKASMGTSKENPAHTRQTTKSGALCDKLIVISF